MKYTIPSKGRSDSIGHMIDLLGSKDTLIYVHQSEKDDYSKVLTKSQLRTHNVFGIGAIRKEMYDDNLNENYTFQFDDDIISLEYKLEDRMTVIVDASHIRAVIDNCYQMALDIGTPLFGLAAGLGPMLYSQLNLVQFSGFVNAINTGVIPKLMGDINWDPRFTVQHEDHDLTLQVKYHKRYVYIDGRYSIKSPAGSLNENGLSTIRSKEARDRCRELLITKYGNRVITPSPKQDNRIRLMTGF
ncbi:hypothetical protein OAU44_00120 [bacterium]|nr:hypothetical protein [bacterium]